MSVNNYETQQYLILVTSRYHQRKGKYPTADEVIRRLKKLLFFHSRCEKYAWNKRQIRILSYKRFAIEELIRRIARNPKLDPIWIIYEFKDYMDDIQGESDNIKTSEFVSALIEEIDEILIDL